MVLRIELSEFADRLNEKNGKAFWDFTKTMGLILLTFPDLERWEIQSAVLDMLTLRFLLLI